MVPDGVKMGSLVVDGTISSKDFRVSALAFAEKWNKCSSSITSPQCSWVPLQKRAWIAAYGGEGYLSLENVFLCSSTEEDHSEGSRGGEEGVCYSDQDDPIDNASLVLSHGHEVHRYEFHIVYSSSYRVPVLYFRAYRMDGELLALDDIKKDLSANTAKVLLESKWTFITQEEHPHLNRPWYCLHPCGTSEWLKLLLFNAADTSQARGKLALENYLVSWFSVVGQVFGLGIPLQMFTSPGTLPSSNHSL